MTTTSPEIAERLARRGRVRSLAPDATVEDVIGRMPKPRAAGLLHDGAGWDSQRIADLMGTSAAQVRRHVFRARLDAAAVDCTPCSDQVDGLMTFAAEATAHAMECESCAVTREALRTGKGRIRDQWRSDETKPVRPWESGATRPPRDRDVTPRPDVTLRPDVAGRTPGPSPATATRRPSAPDRAAPVPDTSHRTDTWPGMSSHPRPVPDTADADRWPSGPQPSRHPRPIPITSTRPSTAGLPEAPASRSSRRRRPEGDTRPAGADTRPVAGAGAPGSAATPTPTGRILPIPNRSVDREPVDAPPRARRRRVRLPRVPVAALTVSALALTMVAGVSASGGGEEVMLVTPEVEESVPDHAEALAVLPPSPVTRPRVQVPRAMTSVYVQRPAARVRQAAPVEARTPEPEVRETSAAASPTVEPSRAPDPRPTPQATATPARPAPQPAPAPAPPPPPPPPPAPAPDPPPAPTTPSAETWDRLAQCESSGNWAANTGNGFYGGLQFTLESWEGVGGTGLPSDAPRAEQIARAEALWRLQGWNAWPSCSRQLGLR